MTARRGEDGISNVLGAILLFGLFVLTLVVIQVEFVPVWTEDREARAMQALADDLRQLKSDVDRQAANDTAGTITDSIALRSSGGFQFFRSAGEPGSTASFIPAPAGTGVAVASSNPVQVLRRGGDDLFGLTDDWPDYEDGEIEDVGRVTHLRVRIDTTPSYDNGDNVTLEVYGADDAVNPLGWASVTFSGPSSQESLHLQVFNAAGNEVSAQTEEWKQQLDIPFYYFDLLDESLLFGQIIRSGQAPYTLAFLEGGLAASYQIAYTDTGSGTLAGGSGSPAPSFASTQPSGRLVLEGRNERYVDQTYVLEHGAIVLVQDTGAAILAGPALTVGITPTQGSLRWTLPGLSGDGVTRGGDRVSAAASPSGTIEDVWFIGSDATITLPTLYGAAWAEYLDTLLQADGWTPGQYTLTPSSANVVLDVTGPVATEPAVDPGDYDVSIEFRLSQIDLTLSSG